MFNSDSDIARVCRVFDTAHGRSSFARLTPDTAPDAIQAAQRLTVAEAHAELRTLDVAVLSDACDLPRWNVERALVALKLSRKRLPPTAITMRKRGRARAQRVADWLAKQAQPYTVAQIAAALKLTRPQVRQCIMWDGGPFKRFGVRRGVKGGHKFQLTTFDPGAVPA